MLESLKDPNTGQLKKPVLFSLIGGAGLVGYLLISGKSSGSTAGTNGQASAAPDLTALTDAVKGLTGGSSSGGGGGTGDSSGNTDGSGGHGLGGILSDPNGPPILTAPTTVLPGETGGGDSQSTIGVGGTEVSGPSVSSPNMAQPAVPQAPGSSGSAGGGGSGTGQVIHPISKAPSVYGGLAALPQAPGVLYNGTDAYNAALQAKIKEVAARSPNATQSSILATAKKDLQVSSGSAAAKATQTSTATLISKIKGVNAPPPMIKATPPAQVAADQKAIAALAKSKVPGAKPK